MKISKIIKNLKWVKNSMKMPGKIVILANVYAIGRKQARKNSIFFRSAILSILIPLVGVVKIYDVKGGTKC